MLELNFHPLALYPWDKTEALGVPAAVKRPEGFDLNLRRPLGVQEQLDAVSGTATDDEDPHAAILALESCVSPQLTIFEEPSKRLREEITRLIGERFLVLALRVASAVCHEPVERVADLVLRR